MTDREILHNMPARTGRRSLLHKAEPRDKTVCFTLSERERLDLDKLCLSMNITRSGLLSNVVVSFVTAAMSGGDSSALLPWLEEATQAHEKYGEQTEKIVKNQ